MSLVGETLCEVLVASGPAMSCVTRDAQAADLKSVRHGLHVRILLFPNEVDTCPRWILLMTVQFKKAFAHVRLKRASHRDPSPWLQILWQCLGTVDCSCPDLLNSREDD